MSLPAHRPDAHLPLGGLAEALRHGGESGRRIAETDWAATPLGPISSWSPALRASVSLMLGSRSQIVLFWGPQFTALYNDTYAPTIGDKDDWALGRPACEGWSELWDDLGPLLEGVRASGESFVAVDRPFVIERSGFPEQVFFDVSYDPVRGDSGVVEGIFCFVRETTARVVGERRLRTLRRLAERLAQDDDANIAASVCEGLAGVDVPCLALVLDDGNGTLDVACSTGMEPRDELPGRVRGLLTPGTVEFDLGLLASEIPEEAAPRAQVVALRAGTRTVGALVAGTGRQARLDDGLREFLQAAADYVAQIVVDHRARAEERRGVERLRGLADRLQRAFLPAVLPDLPGVVLAARYLPGTSEGEVGGDWYDAIELAPGRLAIVLGDVVGRGVEAAIVMAQLRTAMRAFLVEGRTPAEALDRLEHLVGPVPDVIGSTVVCAVLDVATGQLTHASAGHLPALVVGPDGNRRWLRTGRSAPLGARFAGAHAHEGSDVLAPGETLVVFTDGLVERRGHNLDTSLEALGALAVAHADSPTEIVDGLIAELLADAPADDTAILALQRR